jgi:hypothetical protein
MTRGPPGDRAGRSPSRSRQSLQSPWWPRSPYRGRVSAVREVLGEREWLARRAAHEARVDAWVRPHLQRAARGEKHPVEDFLFTYYAHRPARLRRWSPGPGVALAGPSARALLADPHWVQLREGVALTTEVPAPRQEAARRVAGLLAATASRAASFACFGLHEWAMVYGQEQQEVRHARWPLRLGPAGTAEVLDRLPLRCTHVDAYRFFAAAARPRNAWQLSRPAQEAYEQPGCLHATMDLYKCAYRLDPWVPAELVADCFALAQEVRALDMRASPYDLSALGYQPVPVETADGRAAYAAAQRAFTDRARPLRERVLAAARNLQDWAGTPARR